MIRRHEANANGTIRRIGAKALLGRVLCGLGLLEQLPQPLQGFGVTAQSAGPVALLGRPVLEVLDGFTRPAANRFEV